MKPSTVLHHLLKKNPTRLLCALPTRGNEDNETIAFEWSHLPLTKPSLDHCPFSQDKVKPGHRDANKRHMFILFSECLPKAGQMMVLITMKTYLSFLMLFSNSIRMEQCCDFIFTPHTVLSCEKSHTIKTQWVRFRYLFMIITDVAIEILDVTPMESKDSDKRKTYVSFFSEDCSVLNVEIMTVLLWRRHSNLSSVLPWQLK